ncbi:MAG: TIM barrel protein [Verrucomicrobia bacterium]|nr:TIM barrel protein [Verrucomicrobiota bacterium]
MKHQINRRDFLRSSAAALAVASGAWPGETHAASRRCPRIGSCMIGLPEAKQAGLDGAEVRVGPVADHLQIADKAVRQSYKDQMRETGLVIPSVVLGILNSAPLASDPRGPAWLEQTIDAAADLGAKVILVAFFSKGDLLDADRKVKQKDVDVVVERIRAAAPRAKAAGVTLAIENTLPATENIRILDRIGHEAVKVYYDVYNTGVTKGYDVPAELRLLKDRVAQVHFKNGPQYLEDRKGYFEPIVAALNDIRYSGWIVLETSNPSKNPVADTRRNAEFIRRLYTS